MSDYDPRTDTGIPTEPVGSLPRPSSLQKAYGEYDAGTLRVAPVLEDPELVRPGDLDLVQAEPARERAEVEYL